MKMQNFKPATPSQVQQEKDKYLQWLLENGYSKQVASNYVSRWSRVDKIANQLGYPHSILSSIVGLVLKGELEAASYLTLLIRNQLQTYYRKYDPTTKAWNDVATSLKTYAIGYLNGNQNQIQNVKNPAMQPWVLTLSGVVATIFNHCSIRNILRRRLVSQDRGGLPMKKINSILSKYPDYQKWLNDLVDSVIFIGYVPIDDPYFQNPVEVPFKDITKLLIDLDNRILFRKKNDVTVYTLLTPIAFSNSLRPAKARKFSMLEIDHNPAISKQLQNLAAQIPTINGLANNNQNLLKELQLLHKNLVLRIMEAKENRKKGTNLIFSN